MSLFKSSNRSSQRVLGEPKQWIVFRTVQLDNLSKDSGEKSQTRHMFR